MTSPPSPTVLYPRERIAARVAAIAAEIDRAYAGRPVTLCGVLTGGVIFASDLARAMANDRLELSFVRASSYGSGRESAGSVELQVLDENGIAGRDVVVVEDILETGRTLAEVVRGLEVCGARSVRTCVLLDKPGRRVVAIEPDWTGFVMEEPVFVAGYGLDAGHRWRNLPDIVVAPDAAAGQGETDA